MADRTSLPAALDAELDEVLSMLPLLDVVPTLADRVFVRLTDGLVEAVLHDIRVRHESGALDRSAYLTEICGVVVDLQECGLLGADTTGTI